MFQRTPVFLISILAFTWSNALAQCPSIISAAVQDNLCAGDELGSISLNVTNGIPPYTYVWSQNGVPFSTIINNPAIFGLAGGDYSLDLSDNLGCTITDNFIVFTPDPFLAPTIQTTPPTCNQQDGSISAILSGGTTPYQYFWSTGDNVPTVTGLPPGNYTLTVTDIHNCESYVEEITLESDSDLDVFADDMVQNCAFDIGTMVANVTGGTSPYQYQWSPATGLSDPTIANPNVVIETLFTTYTVWVTDANGCVAIDEATVTLTNPTFGIVVDDVNCFGGNDGWIQLQTFGNLVTTVFNGGPPSTQTEWFGLSAGTYQIDYFYSGCNYTELVTITEPATLLEVSGIITNASCDFINNGAIDLTITGGTPPYDVQWPTGATTEDEINLIPGLYEVTVTDTDTCQVIQQFLVGQNTVITATPSLTFETCNGANDGSITIQANNGIAPYNFLWSTGETAQGLSTSLNNLPAGTYFLTINDAQGCSNVFNYSLLPGPVVPPILLSPPSPNPLMYDCDDLDQSALLSISVFGGFPSQDFSDYIFDLSGTGTSSDVTGFNIPVDAPIEFEVADGASWMLTVYDDQGCDQVTLTDTYNYATDCTNCADPSNLIVDAGPDQVTCGTSLTLGGNPTATSNVAINAYQWIPSIELSDATIPNPAVNPTEDRIYQVIVTDGNGCIATDEVFVQAFPPLQVEEAIITPSTCDPNGIIDLVNSGVTGGVAPYTWLWTGPNGYSSTTPISTIGLAGNETYCLDITDAVGCTVQECFFVPTTQDLEISAFLTTPDCGDEDGSATVVVSGGVAPYTFNWTDGQVDSLAIGLDDGNYCVNVIDAVGCSVIGCVDVLPEDCVWPGDANYDGFANNEDILALGLTFGFTGPTRPNSNIAYIGQPADDWPAAFLDGVNHKHADCDGDGVVAYLDTLAISLNYGLEHPFNFGTPDYNSNNPPLFLVASADTVAPGALVTVDLEYGDMDHPITDFYGIALGIELEEDYVVPESFMADFSNSWVGSPSEQITIAKYLPGIFEIGISRIDQQNVDGFGKIARFTFVIEDNIDGFQAIGPVPLIMEIVNVTIISNDESTLPFFPINGEVIIDPESTSLLSPNIADQINLFPNPAHDRIVVEHVGIEVQFFRIIDVMGRPVDQQFNTQSDQNQINLNGLLPGAYILEIQTENGHAFKRFIKD